MYKNYGTRVREAVGIDGMVCTAHPLATLAGAKTLMEGGNALDAAVAAAAVTWVVLPHMCGLGGDAFFLYYDSGRSETTCFSGCGAAPLEASVEKLVDLGVGRLIPLEGPLGVAVPGALHAVDTGLKKFGTMELARVLEPAISVAQRGFAVTPGLNEHMGQQLQKIRKFPATAQIFLDRQGRPLEPGAVLSQPDLANTLRTIARQGAESFYRGELSSEIAGFIRSEGGLLGEEDLARHETEVSTPLRTGYKDYEVAVTRLPSQGFIVLEALNILEDFVPVGAADADVVHAAAEAVKIGFLDRLRYAGDPRFAGSVDETLASKSHAANRRRWIDMSAAAPKTGWPQWGEPPAGWHRAGSVIGDTTYIAVVDREGNACSFIHSLAISFGSGMVVPGTGILLNNRAARSFTLDPRDPNCIEPGKRPVHTLNCYMVFRGGRLRIVGGTPGGDGQVQWNVQILQSLLDRGISPQQAVERPRWTLFPGSDAHAVSSPLELRLEGGFPEEVARELGRRGHPIVFQNAWEAGGGAQVILVDHEKGVLVAGSDPRVEGLALGL